ncbi:MAG TPA: glycine C-acetyltransferase [Thermoanaerobaculia bacterium]|nr:glycine C-acetyltransferase [Thermoanaerobaculia bacterium]
MTTLIDHLAGQMAELRARGTYKEELVLQSPQDARVQVAGREVVMLTSNNYLGFANHPRVREAQKKAIDRWGAGMASVRFICGTEALHKELEAEIASFFGKDDAILYMSCWNANEGLFPAILEEPDGLYSDELNHASIIDGVRLCKAKRYRVPHSDMQAFEKMLTEDTTSRFRLMMTDGVFSMEGEEARLRDLVRICGERDVLLVVDDSHATGVLGPTGRGTAEAQGVMDRIDVFTGTLGKAMGSAAGGFTTGPKALVETLRQRSRPSLFSNSLPPSVVAGSLESFRMLREDPAPVRKLAANTAYFRKAISESGFKIPHGNHPIVPVIVGETAKALAMGKALLEEGIYVSGFGYPVVPHGHARLRCQVSAAHETSDLDKAIEAFRKVGKKFEVI